MVALMNVLIWLLAWTPYAIVVLIGTLGDRQLVTPLVSQLPSMLAKTGSCFNPLVTIISHPKLKHALAKTCPWLGIKPSDRYEKKKDDNIESEDDKSDPEVDYGIVIENRTYSTDEYI